MTRKNKAPVTKNQGLVFAKDLALTSTKNATLAEIKHRKIVHGACKVFFKKGYHPTTIRDIAKACGMSMGQLYHYVTSKDDVLYLVHKHMHKIWYDHLKHSEFGKTESPRQRLIETLRNTTEFLAKNKKLIQFVYTESKYLDKDHLRVVLEMDYKNVIGLWRVLLKQVDKEKSVNADLDFLASLITFCTVFLPLRGWTLKDRPVEKNIDSLLDFILKGLGII